MKHVIDWMTKGRQMIPDWETKLLLVGIGWWVWNWGYKKINPFELENGFFLNWSLVTGVVEFAGLNELVFINTTQSALFKVNLFLFFFFWLLTCIKIIVLIILLCIIAPRLLVIHIIFFLHTCFSRLGIDCDCWPRMGKITS